MTFRPGWFNLNLAAWCCLVVVLAFCGCSSSAPSKDKIRATVRVHIEANADRSNRTTEVPIYRASPVLVNVEANPVVSEMMVSEARVVDTVGGFALRIAFNQEGRLLLEQATAENRGRHYAVYCQFPSLQDPTVTQGRWLAAPVITTRVTDGMLMFTPDATREEAYEIALGLNHVAARNGNAPAAGKTF